MDYAHIAQHPEEFGIRWEVEDVSKQFGPHATDRQVVGQIPIAVPTNLALWVETFGEQSVLDTMNGTSIRVKCQNKHRPLLAKGEKLSMDTMKENVIRLIAGVKTRSTTTIERKVYVLPDDTETYDREAAMAAWLETK